VTSIVKQNYSPKWTSIMKRREQLLRKQIYNFSLEKWRTPSFLFYKNTSTKITGIKKSCWSNKVI